MGRVKRAGTGAEKPHPGAGRAGRAPPIPAPAQWSVKRTGTATQTTTGLLFASAGLKTHCLTAVTAAASSMGIYFATLVSFTRPSLPIMAQTVTVPSTLAERASSGYSGGTFVTASGSSS